jgi:hypothetical protein
MKLIRWKWCVSSATRGPADSTSTDLEQAYWLGCSYIITSVEAGKAQLTRSFALAGTTVEDKTFVEEELLTEP